MAGHRRIRQRTRDGCLALFLLTAGFIAIRTGRDALYLQGDGLYGLPKAYIATAVLAVPQAMAMLWLLQRIGTRATRLLVLVAVTVLTGSYFLLAVPGGSMLMTAFFFLVPLLFSVAFSMMWLLGTELTDTLPAAEATKAFSHFGASSILGGLAGGAFARALGPFIGPRALLLSGGVLMACTLFVTIFVHRRNPPREKHGDPSERPPEQRPNMLASLRQPNVALLLGIAMAASIAGIQIDFQLYLGAAGGSAADNTVYFANVYLVLSGISLFLQLVIAPWIAKRTGLKNLLLVLPAAVFGGAAAVLVLGTVLSRVGLRVMEGSLKAGVHRTTWEQAFLRYPPEHRAVTKVMVDGLAARIAEGFAGLALHTLLVFAAQGVGLSALDVGWVAKVSAIWVTIGLIAAAGVWLLLTFVLSRQLKHQAIAAGCGDLAVGAPLPDS